MEASTTLPLDPTAPSNQYNIPANGQLPLPAGIYPTSRPDQMRIPEVDGWNLTIQQQLGATTSFSLAYVGNKSTHSIPNSTWGGINWNDYTIVGFAQGLSQCQRSVFFAKWGTCGPGYIGYYANEANAHYNSLQATFEKRFSRGLQMNSSYVWSERNRRRHWHLLSDRSPCGTGGTLTSTAPMTLSSLETTLFPLGAGSSSAPAFLDGQTRSIGGLALNANLHLASGLPYTPSYGECGSDGDNGPCRPNLLHGQIAERELAEYCDSLRNLLCSGCALGHQWANQRSVPTAPGRTIRRYPL